MLLPYGLKLLQSLVDLNSNYFISAMRSGNRASIWRGPVIMVIGSGGSRTHCHPRRLTAGICPEEQRVLCVN